MYRGELQKLEGVWTGTEVVTDGGKQYEASARLVFQTVFDGRFLLCDYVQTAPDHPTSVAHGVFRKEERTNVLTVTWFRSPVATTTQQADAVSEGDKLVFLETVDGRKTRTTYSVVLNKLSVRMECAVREDDWKTILEGTYRRR